jgi:hypothetical protein
VKVNVYMTVLSSAGLNAFKLALVDAGSAGPSTIGWDITNAGYLGSILCGHVTLKECVTAEHAAHVIGDTLAKHGVQYLSLIVRDDQTGCVCLLGGTMAKTRNEGPYRSPPGASS